MALEESVIILCGGVRPRKFKGLARGQLENDKASTESLFLLLQIKHTAKTQVPHTNLEICLPGQIMLSRMGWSYFWPGLKR